MKPHVSTAPTRGAVSGTTLSEPPADRGPRVLSITMSTFGTFIVIQTLTNGGPGNATEVIALFAFHTAFKSFSIGYGSAIAVVMLALNFRFRDHLPGVGRGARA